MTNEMIIFVESQKLAKEGKINYTGRVFKAVDDNGKEVEYKETEPIHTFQMWKSLGYSVKKGQHAVAQFTIWKHAGKTEEVEMQDGSVQEIDKSRMFMKKSSFFSLAQDEKKEVAQR